MPDAPKTHLYNGYTTQRRTYNNTSCYRISLCPSMFLLARMSSKKGRVTFNSKLTVVSSKPVKPGMTHPLSTLDHAMGLHSLHIVYYYKDNLFDSFDLDPLRESLSEVISLYPAVTGRLTRRDDGNWEVKCNDAGVRVIRARVGATLDEWLRSADGSEEMDLTMWEDMPQDPNMWSPFRIQISDFEGGGVAIGLSCSHMHADTTSAILLFQSWSQACRREPIEQPPFFIPQALCGRPIPNTHTKSSKYYATKSKAEITSLKMATATFKFSNSVIQQCLTEVYEDCPNATPFDLLAALFWTRITSLKGHKNEFTNSLSICIDFRRQLQTPLPYEYFGNALHFSVLSLKGGEVGQATLGCVVQSVHRHVAGIEEEEYLSVIDWFEAQKGEGGKFAQPFRMYGPELTCISLEHMVVPSSASGSPTRSSLIYAATFDKDIKPVHISYHVGNVDGEGLIVVLPSSEEGLARTVMVTLPERELAELCEDQDILCLEPTMLLSGKR